MLYLCCYSFSQSSGHTCYLTLYVTTLIRAQCPASSLLSVHLYLVSYYHHHHHYSHVKLLSMMTTYVDMVAGNHTQ